MEEKADPDRWQSLISWLALITSLLAFSGVILFGFQCLLWLINGSWTAFPIGSTIGLNADGIGWLGLRAIIQWFLDQSLAVALIVVPFLAFALIVTALDD